MSLASRMTALAVVASVLTASGASTRNGWNWFFSEAEDPDPGAEMAQMAGSSASFEDVVLMAGRLDIRAVHGMAPRDDGDPIYISDNLGKVSRTSGGLMVDRLLFDTAEPGTINLGFTPRTGLHSIYFGANPVPQGDQVTADSALLTSPVPESQTYALMLAGLAMVCMVLRRRRP